MKYIITENRLNNVILNWMDETYGDLQKIDNPTSLKVYLFKESDLLFLYDKRNGYVKANYPEVGNYLQSLFNLDLEQSEEIIKSWLETRHNLEPRFVEFKN